MKSLFKLLVSVLVGLFFVYLAHLLGGGPLTMWIMGWVGGCTNMLLLSFHY